MSMWYGALAPVGPVLTLRSTLEPALTLVAVAKPSIPLSYARPAFVSFQPALPGVQFSTTVALPVEQDRASGLACASEADLADSPVPSRAVTA